MSWFLISPDPVCTYHARPPALGFIYGVEEETTTEAPADILLEAPPSTIPFDEDSPPHQLPSELLPPSQEVSHSKLPITGH